jgi:hypothetical protein
LLVLDALVPFAPVCVRLPGLFLCAIFSVLALSVMAIPIASSTGFSKRMDDEIICVAIAPLLGGIFRAGIVVSYGCF